MRAIASLTSFAVLLMLQGPAVAPAGGAEAEIPTTDVPETLSTEQATAKATQVTEVPETMPQASGGAEDAQSGNAQPTAGGSDALLDQARLDQLVAPIALYPDPLLAQVLVAATYPLEVVQAERWAEDHKDVTGEALTKAMDDKNWDNSIKALVAVPDVLAMMNKDLDWTARLGDAVLAQQSDVMDALQRMRALAYENGKLESNDQQKVTVTQEVTVNQAAAADEAPASQEAASQQSAPQQVIVIEPTSPEVVYVPYYQPSVVYGTWPYPSYPPYYFPPPPGYAFGGALARGLAWSAGFAIGNAIWGNGFNWGRNDIRVDVNRNIDFSPNVNINKNDINVSNWQHNSEHRRGVNYNNAAVENKFSKGDLANRREDFRGREPGDRRPGDGGGLADRTPGDSRPGDRTPGAGTKRPDVADMEKALNRTDVGAKRPDAGARRPETGAKRSESGVRRPETAAKRPNAGAQRPAARKPDAAKRPAANRPSGNAFQKRDGSKARSHSTRGRASVGNRSASHLSRGRPSGHRGGGRGGGRRR